MTTTQALQNLQDEFRQMMDHAKSTQTCVNQLRNAKKEADITKKRQELLESLRTMQDSVTQLQQHMRENQGRLEEAVHASASDQKEEEKPGQSAGQEKDKGLLSCRNLTVEQQEALYELKESRMGAMKTQNQALKREVAMTQRRKHLLHLRHTKNESFSGSDTWKAVHALECKNRSANLKIEGLEKELRKSQQMALRYRNMYEESQHDSQTSTKPKASTGSPDKQSKSSKPTVKSAPLPEQSFISPKTNVNDVVRKNECLLEENEVLQREVQRLKRDNSELVRMTKTAASSRDSVLGQLSTSEMARADLQKRYNKLKNKNSQLSQSMTRETARWLEGKKQQQYFENQQKWIDMNPVCLHSAKDRFQEHRAKENTDLPRQMYPVESYA